MFIRKEETKDYETVYSVVKRAFDSAEHADGNEHDLVKALRLDEAFIPELSLVAVIDGKIVGHIINEMKKENVSALSTAQYIKCMFFETPLIYFTLLTLNIVGCCFVAEKNFNQFMGNLLIVIPNNVLLILGYFNILKEKYNQ